MMSVPLKRGGLVTFTNLSHEANRKGLLGRLDNPDPEKNPKPKRILLLHHHVSDELRAAIKARGVKVLSVRKDGLTPLLDRPKAREWWLGDRNEPVLGLLMALWLAGLRPDWLMPDILTWGSDVPPSDRTRALQDEYSRCWSLWHQQDGKMADYEQPFQAAMRAFVRQVKREFLEQSD